MATDSTRRLHHHTPAWVESGAIFHIRLRVDPGTITPLTAPPVAQALLDSTLFYHRQNSWHRFLLLLMPDHVHALLAFPCDRDMRLIVGRWKAWQTRTLKIQWQDNFFDHRIRNRDELQLKAHYNRRNPAVKGLSENASDWPWVAEPSGGEWVARRRF